MDAALYDAVMNMSRLLSYVDHKITVDQSMRIRTRRNSSSSIGTTSRERESQPFYFDDKFQMLFLLAFSFQCNRLDSNVLLSMSYLYEG